MGSGIFNSNQGTKAMSTVAQAGISVGTILYSSWGYDQTNVEFYEVIRASDSMVLLQPIGDQRTADGDMTGTTVPDQDLRWGEILRRAVRQDGSVRINDCETAWVWDGKPVRFSSYA